jgi:hypothetical protein
VEAVARACEVVALLPLAIVTMGCEAVMDNESIVGSDVIVFGVAEFAACSVVIVGVSSKTLGPGL